MWQTFRRCEVAELLLKGYYRQAEIARRLGVHPSTISRDVYDPFLGSGTMIVAAEQLGRCCFGIEIFPPYVAVTLEPMSQMGLESKLLKENHLMSERSPHER